MNILVLRSNFQTDDFVEKEYAELLGMLKSEFQADITILGDESEAIEHWQKNHIVPDYVMTATGGVENLFLQVVEHLDSDIRLIADGRNNSLAAALEILSFIFSTKLQGHIIHGDNNEIVAAIRKELKPLSGTRIGLFGRPSDWLIASNVNRDLARQQYGISIIDINLQRLVDEIKLVDSAKADEVAQHCEAKATQIVEPTHADMIEAAKTYLALRKICLEEHLTAMTIRCFDIVKACGTTSCLALALLNDEGIVAGCEGDLQTLLTMVLAQRVTGEKAFMANPSMLTDNTTMLAHCTLPLAMCDSFKLRSHFESQKGVAIQGMLPLTDYTILKWGGTTLKRFFCIEAKAIEYEYSEHYCRTQILLDANMKDYFLNSTIGNHHVIIRGRHKDELNHFMETYAVQ